MKAGLITEWHFDNGKRKERVRLFTYKNQTFMATWDGKLIPHECAKCLVGRIFSRYYDENGNLKN